MHTHRWAYPFLVIAASALLVSCATTQSATVSDEATGDYANASVLSCKVEDCVAHVAIDATCNSGQLTVQIWRDVPVRGEPLHEGELGQTLIHGRKTLDIPVCAPSVRPVQALALRVDGACADDPKDVLTAQFRCFR